MDSRVGLLAVRGALRALERAAVAIDALCSAFGRAAAWLQPLLVAVLAVNVALRYGLGRGSVELEELQWHLFAANFLLGLAWVQARDGHVRVDLLRSRLPPRGRAAVDLAGHVLLLLPFAAIATAHAWGFFARSFAQGERSPMPSGLPARWVIKGVLLAALGLLALQALASALRSLRALLEPGATAGEEEAPWPRT